MFQDTDGFLKTSNSLNATFTNLSKSTKPIVGLGTLPLADNSDRPRLIGPTNF